MWAFVQKCAFFSEIFEQKPTTFDFYEKIIKIFWSVYLFLFTFVQNKRLKVIAMKIAANKAHSIKPYWDVEEDADEMQPALKPYTMEEINAMIDQAEREMAAGLGQDSEDMFRELAEEFTREDMEYAMAEAV